MDVTNEQTKLYWYGSQLRDSCLSALRRNNDPETLPTGQIVHVVKIKSGCFSEHLVIAVNRRSHRATNTLANQWVKQRENKTKVEYDLIVHM